jgi:hypothetical protein
MNVRVCRSLHGRVKVNIYQPRFALCAECGIELEQRRCPCCEEPLWMPVGGTWQRVAPGRGPLRVLPDADRRQDAIGAARVQYDLRREKSRQAGAQAAIRG